MKLNEIIDVVLAQPRAIALLRKEPEFSTLPLEEIRAAIHSGIGEEERTEGGASKVAELTGVVEEIANAFCMEGARLARELQVGYGVPPEKAPNADRAATQEFSVRNVLTTHCGRILTPALVDRITAELAAEMQTGPTAWAFGHAKTR